MAADTITYDDKTASLSPSNPATELVRAVDLNEVKTVVNAHATNIDEVVIESFNGLIESPEDKAYVLILKAAYDGSITETTTQSTSGTCTATFTIGATELGGSPNSVSSSEQSQAHVSENTFSAGDTITMTVSSNSSCVDFRFSISMSKTIS